MRKPLTIVAIGFMLLAVTIYGRVSAQDAKTDSSAASMAAPPSGSAHVHLAPADIKWGEMPPAFPSAKGLRFAVLAGNPGATGMFTLRIKMPAGYKIAPHWHPTDEHVTVISGTFFLGMGDKFDDGALQVLPTGGYAVLPAEMHHYAMSKTGATVQVSGNGPFTITYVNPEDDPRNKK